MLTKEQVEQCRTLLGSLTVDASKPPGQFLMVQPEWTNRVNTLCDMALAWLAVQPRPIEEAPDHWVDERCLVWVDPYGVDMRSATDGGYWKMANKRCVAKGEPPLYLSYLPLSALPTPAGRE